MCESLLSSAVYCGFCDEEITATPDHSCYWREFYAEENLPDGKVNYNLYCTEVLDTPSDYDAYGLPIELDTSPAVEDITSEDEWDGIYANRDNYERSTFDDVTTWLKSGRVQTRGNFRYRDLDQNTCTHATHWWTDRTRKSHSDNIRYATVPHLPLPYRGSKRSHPRTFSESYGYDQKEVLDYGSPQLAALEFHELQGMVSQQLIDYGITENYQFRFFNVFMGRDLNLHVGLLTFNTKTDGKPEVICKYPGCYFGDHPFPYTGDYDRDSMEQFVADVIRHGNNHGPKWLTSRPDFALIGKTDFVNVKADALGSFEEVFAFLLRHRKFCRNSKCRCTHYYHLLNERTGYAT